MLISISVHKKNTTVIVSRPLSSSTGSLCDPRPSSSRACDLCHVLRRGLPDLSSSCHLSGCWESDSAGQSTSDGEPRIAVACLLTRGCLPLSSAISSLGFSRPRARSDPQFTSNLPVEGELGQVPRAAAQTHPPEAPPLQG
jgi:hypothetical protein